MSDMSDAYREMVLEKLAALEKERDRTLTDWREYKASKDADVAAWKTKADATADERDAALADNAALTGLLKTHARTVPCPSCAGIGSRTCSTCDGGDVVHHPPLVAEALARSHPGAALLEEHRKALEILNRVHPAVRELLSEHDASHRFHWSVRCITCAPRNARERAMKEPES